MATEDSSRARLAALSKGFRRDYLDYDSLTAQLRAWADAFPDIVRLRSLGRTHEGRELWLLTIGPEPDRARPSVWIDGNMHAPEISGSSVALAIAEDVIALHLGDAPISEMTLPRHLRRIVTDALFHVMPRISPDGAEAVLKTGRYVRSVPRDERPNRGHARWINEDVDGDGLALYMRKEDPAGDFAVLPDVPGLLVPRTIDDPPPYYKLFPEGRIESFDGVNVPTPDFLSDSFPDLNRNFPFHWAAEHEQPGAGAFPGSEPEARAIIEVATRTPSIYAWLNLHTFGGVFIRPPGDVPDEKMNAFDLAVYRQVGQWAESITGYPMVSGFAEFLYEPGKPLHGALSEWAYEDRGALSYVCELWDLMAKLGIERPAKFVDYYSRFRREDWIALARWDVEHNRGRIFRPWKRVQHPQLGEVEVGGLDRRVGLFNPSYEELPAICAAQSALMMRVASLLPRVVVSRVEVAPLREDVTELSVVVENHGYLPTYGMQHARSHPHNEPLWADVTCDGCTLEETGAAHRLVGHLEGWGRGLGSGAHSIFFPHSNGSETSRTLRWVVRGRGAATVRIGSCRTGYVERRVGIGGGA
ncbi:MAG: M14 family metallopeptidase [Myxococcota bacterium]|nr:M14 family metallopeptidase [Myxococcota bacterium]